jgi:hypothetical protein
MEKDLTAQSHIMMQSKPFSGTAWDSMTSLILLVSQQSVKETLL